MSFDADALLLLAQALHLRVRQLEDELEKARAEVKYLEAVLAFESGMGGDTPKREDFHGQ